MWQQYALGSLFAAAFENVADKAGIVRDGAVDSYVASFYRSFFFLIAIACVGATGMLGTVTPFFHWSFIPLSILIAFSSILFTYLLRTVELSVLGATAYVATFLFLATDMLFLGVNFTSAQIIGIILLITGGLAFALDGKTHHFRRDLSWRVWGSIVCIYVVATASEAYLFRYLHQTYDINAVTFYTFSTIPGVALLLGLVLARGKSVRLFDRSARAYIPFAAVGKMFDAVTSVLYITAVSLASLAQVSAFNALLPLVLVMIALLIQGLFGIRLREHLDTARIRWKLGAAVVLVVGGILVA